ncbi:CLUMA_CG009834, isoform A [Clunio marinus]|uniref:CLUMA_CG009834, isoform A n=1 Tax=Clunio marinus TaxID=568069 RepID=A0A1J1I9K4_9DIPT|nr:CLUMA_CG009834, isoform A [Clunio marinus]
MSKSEEAESHDHDSSDFDEGSKKGLENLLSNPAYLTSSMKRILLKDMIKNLPEGAQKRVKALKNLQLEFLKHECTFFEEVYQLERKYQEKYESIAEKRKDIIVGDYEPTEAESQLKSDDEEEREEDAMMEENLKSLKAPKHDENVKGIPDFWLTIFRNAELISDMIQPHDEPLLKQLTDIRIKYDEDLTYTLEFFFEPNDYFTDSVLTKKYFLRCKIDSDEPFAFEGPEIYKCTGWNINWKPGKNITVKTVKKKQRHKARGAVRTITKQVPSDSFFNFFNPPDVPEDESKLDEESQNILATDFEIGHFLRARIIPRAVLFFTGDLVDDDSDEDDDEEEEIEEESEEEEEAPEPPQKGTKKRSKGGKGAATPNPAECQQQ